MTPGGQAMYDRSGVLRTALTGEEVVMLDEYASPKVELSGDGAEAAFKTFDAAGNVASEVSDRGLSFKNAGLETMSMGAAGIVTKDIYGEITSSMDATTGSLRTKAEATVVADLTNYSFEAIDTAFETVVAEVNYTAICSDNRRRYDPICIERERTCGDTTAPVTPGRRSLGAGSGSGSGTDSALCGGGSISDVQTARRDTYVEETFVDYGFGTGSGSGSGSGVGTVGTVASGGIS